MMTLAMVQMVSDRSTSEADLDFSRLAREYYEPVYRFILRQAPGEEDAADVTQETFIRAQRGFGSYDPNREFGPWIFTIARRAMADFYRQRRHSHELLEEAHMDPTPGPRELLDDSDRIDAIWIEASRLKPRFHQVLLLHYQEQLSLKDTAASMGVSVVHVKVLLYRARAALKKRLPASVSFEEEPNHD